MVKVRVTESALLYQHESALCVSKFSDDVITVSLVRVMVDESACYVSLSQHDVSASFLMT